MGAPGKLLTYHMRLPSTSVVNVAIAPFMVTQLKRLIELCRDQMGEICRGCVTLHRPDGASCGVCGL